MCICTYIYVIPFFVSCTAAGTTEKSRQFEEQSNIERTFVTASDPVGSIRFTDPKAATAAAVLHKKGLNSTIGGAVRYHPANVPFRHRRVANVPISRPGTDNYS